MANAELSVLLDYVSPPLPIVFWRALRASHFVVALSILVFFLLRVVTIISTSLLVLQQTETPSIEISLLATTKFDASNLTSSGLTLYNQRSLFYNQRSLFYNQRSLSSRLFFEAYAYLGVGLAYPEGLTSDADYQSLAPPPDHSRPENSTYSAEVEAFYANFNCEPAKVVMSLEDGYPPNNQSYVLDATSASCAGLRVFQTLKDPTTTVLPPRELYGFELQWNCSDGAWTGQPTVLMTVSDAKYNQTWAGGVGTNVTSSSVKLAQVTGVICNPTYSIERTNVSYRHTDQRFTFVTFDDS